MNESNFFKLDVGFQNKASRDYVEMTLKGGATVNFQHNSNVNNVLNISREEIDDSEAADTKYLTEASEEDKIKERQNITFAELPPWEL